MSTTKQAMLKAQNPEFFIGINKKDIPEELIEKFSLRFHADGTCYGQGLAPSSFSHYEEIDGHLDRHGFWHPAW